MNISKLTIGQQKALLQSLNNQFTKGNGGTSAEYEVYQQLLALHPVQLTGDAIGYERLGDKVRMINMDTFGEDYRNRWISIQTSSKGEFFTHTYTGGRRVYID